MQDLKKCRYCGKDVLNLAGHIIRIHPNILDKIEDLPADLPISSPVSPNLPAQNVRIGGISQLIQEKLDIMLNIKIIEMLSRSPDTSIQEIATALNPPKSSTLSEIKEYHDLVYGKDPPYVETGNQWLDVAQQAIPMIKEMLPARKKQDTEVLNDVRARETDYPGILKPIQQEAARDPIKPASDRQESGNPSDPKQQNNSGAY